PRAGLGSCESGFRPAARKGRLSHQRSLGPSYSHLNGDTPGTLGRPRRKRTTEPANRVPSLLRSSPKPTNREPRCARRSDDTDAPSGVASGRLAVGSALTLPHFFAAERLSPSARERVPQGSRVSGLPQARTLNPEGSAKCATPEIFDN